MDKIWYICIEGKTEGPFSLNELKADSRLNPDTYVWRQGFDGWRRICDVAELKFLFDESQQQEETEADSFTPVQAPLPEDEIILEMGEEPPYWITLLLLLLVLLYLFQQLYWH